MECIVYSLLTVVLMLVSFGYAKWDERNQAKIRERNWRRFLKENNLEERVEEKEEV